jgi:hypothetical protein
VLPLLIRNVIAVIDLALTMLPTAWSKGRLAVGS